MTTTDLQTLGKSVCEGAVPGASGLAAFAVGNDASKCVPCAAVPACRNPAPPRSGARSPRDESTTAPVGQSRVGPDDVERAFGGGNLARVVQHLLICEQSAYQSPTQSVPAASAAHPTVEVNRPGLPNAPAGSVTTKENS